MIFSNKSLMLFCLFLCPYLKDWEIKFYPHPMSLKFVNDFSAYICTLDICLIIRVSCTMSPFSGSSYVFSSLPDRASHPHGHIFSYVFLYIKGRFLSLNWKEDMRSIAILFLGKAFFSDYIFGPVVIIICLSSRREI